MIDVDLDQVGIPFSWLELFGRTAPTDVEIGSGKGKFLNELATARPDRNLLAVERSAKYHLLFRLLAEGSVDTFFVLFSDPWPKKRHHKRRFFRPDNVAAMQRALAPEGRLLVKSDHDDYATVLGEVLGAASGFTAIDAEEAFADLPQTGFEQKYLVDGRTIHSFALWKQG